MHGRYGCLQAAMHQSDVRFDMILRSLESERLVAMQGQDVEVDFAFDLQSTITRYWIYSIYETLRSAIEVAGDRADGRLRGLYRKFKLVRIPLAKMQVADDRRIKGDLMLVRQGDEPDAAAPYDRTKLDYIAPSFVSTLDGSIGWSVVDVIDDTTHEITRRGLSDELLVLLD